MADVIPLHERPEIHARRWIVLGVMCLSLVMVVMALSAINVALPALQQDLDASATELQWIVDSYGLVFAGLLLTAGAIGDRYGRRTALLGGLAVFAVGAVVGGFADTANMVIVGRAIQGMGAAFVMPATLSMVTTVFPPHERPRAIATWAGFAGAGGAIGPIVSGLLLEHYWWGSAFIVIVPVVAATMIATAVLCPQSRDDAEAPLDPPGAVLSLVGLAALLFGIIEGPEQGWTSGFVVGAFVLAGVALVAFIVRERRTRHPMLPLELFSDRRFSVGSAVVTVAFFVMFGFFFLFSLYLQYARGYSPLDAGLATLPLAATLVAIAPRSAMLAQRFGPGPVMGTGFGFLAAGMFVIATVGRTTPFPVLVVALVLLGAGMSLTSAPATGSIMSAVPMAKAGVGSAVNDTTRELGGALGIAVLGSIVNAAYRATIDLDGLGLSAEQAEAAKESVGSAARVSTELGAEGGELVGRASAAFTQAFNAAAVVQVGMAVLGGIGVVIAMRGRRTPALAPDDDPERTVEQAVS